MTEVDQSGFKKVGGVETGSTNSCCKKEQINGTGKQAWGAGHRRGSPWFVYKVKEEGVELQPEGKEVKAGGSTWARSSAQERKGVTAP